MLLSKPAVAQFEAPEARARILWVADIATLYYAPYITRDGNGDMDRNDEFIIELAD